MQNFKKSDVRNICYLSPMQESMLFHHLLNKNAVAYFEQMAVSLSGRIDIKVFEESFNILIQRYDIFRTVFMYEETKRPVQIVLKERKITVFYQNIQDFDAEKAGRFLEEFKIQDRARGFDLQKDMLMRVSIIQTGAENYEVIWSHHHILMDGWCMGIIIKELLQIYQSLKAKKLLDLGNTYPYSDYINWLEKQDKEEARLYWRNYLAEYGQGASLPKNGSIKPDGYIQRNIYFTLEEELTGKLEQIAANHQVTVNTLFQSIWGILLHKYNNTGDAVFGSVVSGRPAEIPGIEKMVGLFINTIPVRIQGNGSISFSQLIKQVQEAALKSEKYSYLPLAEIQALTSLKQGLIDHIIVFENYPVQQAVAESNNKSFEFRIDNMKMFEQTNYDFNIIVGLGRELSVKLSYNGLAYDDALIQRIVSHFKEIAGTVIGNPNSLIGEITMLSDTEKHQLLDEFNDTHTEYPKDKTIQELFEEQVAKTPDSVALVYERAGAHDRQMTYIELNRKANQLARMLRAKGVKPDSIVGIMVERSLEMLIGIISILKAGGAYLPIDPEYPEERVKFMLEDSDVKILLTQSHLNFGKYSLALETIILDNQKMDQEESTNLETVNQPHDLAYIIYTSGSTGKPKGVMIEHQNVIRLVKNTNYIEFSPEDRILQTGAIVFDASTFEFWGSLLNGLRLYIVDEEVILDTAKLKVALHQNEITIMWLTSPLFNQLCEENPDMFNKLKYLLVGGDALSPNHINRVRRHCQELQIINGYGPTENTTFSVCFKIDREYQEKIPIGIPIGNSTAYIVNQYGHPQPVGVPGELWVGGDGVGRGYLKREELTAQRFIADPFQSGGRIYKTGDLARWLPDGIIEFLGRIDNQVKIRGFRIELGEIENRLTKHEAIQEAIVVAKEDTSGVKYLCAYIVATKELTVPELRECLAKELPDYMIPAYFIQLPKMPLNQNGKINRSALPEPDGAINTGVTYQAPRNETEKTLAAIWQDVLRVEKVSINDNFFELGGHSLKATIIVSRINKELNVEVPLREVFNSPTIQELAEYIQASESNLYAAIEPVANQETYPVSSAQKRMYILAQLEGAGTNYNMPGVMVLEGELDRTRLEAAFQGLVNRHEAFRTSFTMHDGEPVQQIRDQVDFRIEGADSNPRFQADDGADVGATVPDIIAGFIQPFDLHIAPLFRVGLIQINPTKHILMYDMPHIISDGTSMGILIQEFINLYQGQALPPLRIQYKDFAVWQHELFQTDYLQKQEEYWLTTFAGEIPVLGLPVDYTRPALQSFEGAEISIDLGSELAGGLNKLALETGSTLYMVLLAAYNVLLAKYSGQEEIIVGSPIAGRPHADLEPIIGMFVNTLALRNHPAGNKTFRGFLKEVRENSLKAYENQDYQFEELVEKLDLSRDLSRNPLFDVMFILQNLDFGKAGIGGLRVIPYKFENKIAKFDLTLTAYGNERGLNLVFEYCTKIFKPTTIERMATHFTTLIRAMLQDPEIKIAELTMITEAEKQRLLFEFNATHAEYPKDQTIQELFEAQVAKTPDNIALVYQDRQMTYEELNQKANKLAWTLRAGGVKPDSIVGIMAERSFELIIGILGILKAGGAYLPLDPEYPRERIEYLLSDSAAVMVLTQTRFLSQISFENVIDLESKEPYSKKAKGNLDLISRPENLAYIIYTSGSTGKPKGVMIKNSSVVNIITALQNEYPLLDRDTYLLKTTYTFDVSVTELFGWFLAGGKLALLNPGEEKNPQGIVAAIQKYGVTHVNFVPSMLKVFVDILTEQEISYLNRLKYVFVAGEALPATLARKFLQDVRDVKFENIYGPTEITIYATKYSLTNVDGMTNIPIGKPLPNVRTYILDRNNQVTPIGVPGELCIAGDGLAIGYLNRPELTAEKFVPDPFREPQGTALQSSDVLFQTSNFKLHTLYHTGDLVRWLPDGNIEFLGRFDHQVKVRGYRIELGEIENLLLNYPAVTEAVVTAREDIGTFGPDGVTNIVGDKYLCAYLVAGRELTVTELRDYLSRELPDYMVPSYFVQLEELPLTPSGKVDRKSLPAPEGKMNTGSGFEAPRNDIEATLAAIWQDILNIERVGINDNFFQIGGHSLKATLIVARINKELNVEVPLREVFNNPTIKELAEYIQPTESNPDAAIEPVAKQETYSPMQESMLFNYLLDMNSSAYFEQFSLTLKGQIDIKIFEESLNILIGRYDIFRTSFIFENVERPSQMVLKKRDTTVFYKSIEHLKEEEAESFVEDYKRKDREHGFDLSKDILMRVSILKVNVDKYEVIWSYHHILMDGWCMGIVMKEFFQIYHSLKNETPLNLERVYLYNDYITWLDMQDKKEAGLYWQKYLASYEHTTGLPLKNNAKKEGFLIKNDSFTLDRELTKKLEQTAITNHVTLSTVFQCIWGIIIQKYNNTQDVVFGSVVSGRPPEVAGIEKMVGLFINTIPLRIRNEGGETFKDLIKKVQKASLESDKYSYLPLAEIQSHSGLKQALIDHIIAFENYPVEREIMKITEGNESSKADIDFVIDDVNVFEQTSYDFNIIVGMGHELSIKLIYNDLRYDQELIQRMKIHFQEIAKTIVTNTDILTRKIQLLSDTEKHQLIYEFNDTHNDYPKDKTIQELFEEQVTRTPDSIALVYEDACANDRQMTYTELNRKANQLARNLRANGVKQDSIVGIMAERSLEMLIGIIGILKAGGAYLPIDPGYPEERVQFMLEDSGVRILLTQDNLSVEYLKDQAVIILDNQEIYQGETINLETINHPHDLAYIIYTSGSTGKPKGVMVEHQNVIRLVKNTNYIEFSPADRILHTGAIVFDASTFEFWGTLLNGLRLYIVADEVILNAVKLKVALHQNEITILWLTSALFNQLSEEDPGMFDGLKFLLVGGDVLSPNHINRVRRHCPQLQIINGYGPTENTTFSVCYKIDREYQEKIPIGKPISNSTAYIVDHHGNPQPMGVAGELWVGGDGVGRGYLNQPELTAERFIDIQFRVKSEEFTEFRVKSEELRVKNHSTGEGLQLSTLNSKLSTSKMYRTGDSAQWLPDGNIEFLGRIDNQVKIRGFRVELGEIENRLTKHENILEAIVVAKEGASGTFGSTANGIAGANGVAGAKYLCAYIVTTKELTVPGLREYLSQELPDYMIPSYFIQLPKMPLNQNGKIDRRALPEPDGTIDTGVVYEEPRNEIEKTLCAIWGDVLEVERVGINDNFFELGGHSLKATIIVGRIKKELSVEVLLRKLFNNPTIKELAEYIQTTETYLYAAIELGDKQETYSPMQESMLFNYLLNPSYSAYFQQLSLTLKGQIDIKIFEQSLNVLIGRYDIFRTAFIFEKVKRPIQFVLEKRDTAVYYENIEHLNEEESESFIEEYKRKDRERGFDLMKDILIRVSILKVSSEKYEVIWNYHLILMDGWSMGIVMKEFFQIYHSLNNQIPLNLESVYPNSDYITWLEMQDKEEAGLYWQKYLVDYEQTTGLPSKDNTKKEDFLIKNDSFTLNQELTKKLAQIAIANQVTLSTVFQCIWGILLQKYNNAQDVVFGSVVSGRPVEVAEIEKMVGLFINTIPIRIRNEGGETFKTLIKKVHEAVLESDKNSYVSLAEIQSHSRLKQSLLDHIIAFEDYSLEQDILRMTEVNQSSKKNTDFQIEEAHLVEQTSYDFNIIVSMGHELFIKLIYNDLRYDQEMIQRMKMHFQEIAKTVINNIDVLPGEIELLTDTEKQQLLYEFNDTENAYPKEKTIQHLFEEQVDRTPDRIAVVFKNEQLNYRELDQKANQVARYLADNQVGPDSLVGILLESSLHQIIAILGIIKAGGGYVPLDPGLPEARIKTMIQDTEVQIIISGKEHIKVLNRLQWECPAFRTYLCLDSDEVHNEEEKDRNELMDQKLWNYVAQTATDEIGGGGWNSSYTGEDFSQQEMEEYGDNVLTKLQPYLSKETKVLEIGCASGITMYRIAPSVGLYYGTDLSEVNIERNRERIRQEGHINIKLKALPAHEIDQVEETGFDLIILNSVIQFFHGHNYLRQVLGKAIRLMKNQGRIFIGDIMDQDRKEDLTKSLEEFKLANQGKGYRTKTELGNELFVSPGYLEDLRQDLKGITEVTISNKIYTIANELTEYRYDAILEIDQRKTKSMPAQRHKYQEGLRELARFSMERVAARATPRNIAYVLYTSGSTGKPKGVIIEHQGVHNLIKGIINQISFNASEAILVLTTFSFDIFVFETLVPLSIGLKVVVASRQEQMEPQLLRDVIVKNGIAKLQMTPSRLQLLCNELEGQSWLDGINTFMIGGEAFPESLLKKVSRIYSGKIYNGYGPTEATVYTTVKDLTGTAKVDIGKPISNTQIYIVDGNNSLLPVGIAGELCIAGDGLARGYLKRPELTDEKFVPNPFKPGSKMYRTGDLVRWLPDGNIEFLGRIDHQVKIRGYRIELGEIGSRLLKHEAVKEAVVIAKESTGGAKEASQGEKYLCAYIVSDRELTVNELREHLAKELPEYMIPSYFVRLAKLPLTHNGKINRKALPEPDGTIDTGVTFEAPRNKTEKTLAAIWQDVLRVEQVGINDNFFELGGHSIKATSIISRINKELNVEVPLREIFSYPTIQELAQYIQGAESNLFAAIKPVAKQEFYPVTATQRRMYITAQSGGAGANNNMPGFLMIEGELDRNRLEAAFQKLVDRHEAFRTFFTIQGGELVQQIQDSLKFTVTYQETDEANLDRIAAEFVRPFDLGQAPLLRVGLIRVNATKHLLVYDMNHIISDGTSMGVLTQEFSSIYQGLNLPELRIQYKDFAIWQQQLFQTGYLQKQAAYWLNTFAGEIPVLALPTDYKRPALKSYEGAEISFPLGPELAGELNKLILETGSTLYMVLMAVYNVLLAKYSGQEDIIVGSPVAGRRHADLEPIVGMFVNTLPLRNFPVGNKTFLEFLKEVRETALFAFENQEYQFDELVEKLDIHWELNRTPLFDVMFVMQNFKQGKAEFSELQMVPYKTDSKIALFDLDVVVFGNEQEVILIFHYCTKLFKPETIHRMAAHFTTLIRAIIQDPEIKIAELSMISAAEKQQLLYEFNATQTEYPREKTIQELFEEQVAKNPDSIALVYERACERVRQMTYQELNQKANQLARNLRVKGVKPDSIVGIKVERSLEMLIGIIGILKAGGAYLPIDPEYPEERVKFMLEDSGVQILLTQSHLNVGEGKYSLVQETITLDSQKVDQGETTNLETINHPHDLAYIIYTSGSTGKPKGVMVEHQNVIRLVKNTNYIEFSPEDRILHTGAIVFDASTFEFWGSLLNGLQLYIVAEEVILNTVKLNEALHRNGITILWLTSPLFNYLSEENPRMFDQLKYLLVGGDVLSPNHINRVRQCCQELRIINGYGPTENTTFSVCFKIDREYQEKIPIGIPVGNSTAYIVDHYGNPQPIGVPGELWVGGDGVGRGYLKREELTAQRFSVDPFQSGGRIYKTGDLARWLPDGNIEFLGRIDNQVKIRGFRIELGEIESRLTNHENISEAIVVVKEDAGGTFGPGGASGGSGATGIAGAKYLCAYIVAAKELTVSELRDYLSQEMPDYMIPSYFVQLPKMPLNQNGKIDRSALPEPGREIYTGVEYEAPGNTMEELLVNIWKQILGLDKISVHDNFFELGGNSLNAITIVTKLFNEYELDMNLIYMYPTVRELAPRMKKKAGRVKEILEQTKKAFFEREINPKFDRDQLQSELKVYQSKNKQYQKMKFVMHKHPRNVLLTGSTGYLGSHILHELLKHTHDNVYLLVRGESEDQIIEKCSKKYHFYFNEDLHEIYKERLVFIKGDLTKDYLGLSKELYYSLNDTIDCIINSAANVRHYGSYQDFYEINVKGVEQLITFARTGLPKYLHHISTMSVGEGNISGTENLLFTEFSSDIGQKTDNLYVKSKLEAEKIILNARKSGLNSSIHRVGNLVFNSTNGKFQENISENAFYKILKSGIKLGATPEGSDEFSFIDYVSRAVILLYQVNNLPNETYHIYNPNKVNSADLTKFLNSLGFAIEELRLDKYLDHLYEIFDTIGLTEDLESILFNLLNFNVAANGDQIHPVIANEKTLQILDKLGFQWEIVKQEHIARMVDHCREVNYL